ncbi:MAG TPA: hypothetical protein VK171_06180, partial [Fimbriimonas sp.]|nr:hypothetical protein [Fimbriimonas sp.]
GVRVRFGLVESQIKSPVPISLQPVIARETEVIVSRVSNSVTLRDREGIWTGEATVDPTHMSYTVGDPTVLGWIHIPGLPIGVPKPTEPSLPPGYLPDPWPQLRALKDGQKLPATIYRPSGKRIDTSATWNGTSLK